MRKLSTQDLQLLQRVSAAGGSHCFSSEDSIPAAGHKALRSLERRGFLAVDETQDGPLVALTAQGRAEVDLG